MTTPDDRSSAPNTPAGATGPADDSAAASGSNANLGASPAAPYRQPADQAGGADAATTAIPASPRGEHQGGSAVGASESDRTASSDAAARAGSGSSGGAVTSGTGSSGRTGSSGAAEQPSTAAYDPQSDYTGGSLYSQPVQDDPVDVERATPTTVLPASGTGSDAPGGLGLHDAPPAPFPASSSAESAGGSPNYAPAGSDQREYAGVESSGFFAGPGQQLPPRVELAPRRKRFGPNLLGAIVGVVFVALGALVYALLVRPDNGVGFGDKFGLVVSVVLAALPGLLIGWSAAAAWFAGVLLTAAGIAVIFVDQVARTAADWSNRLFDRADPVQFFSTVGFGVGVALLFAGIAGHIARRAGENATIERIKPQA